MNRNLLPKRMPGTTLNKFTSQEILTYNHKEGACITPSLCHAMYLPNLDKKFEFVVGEGSYFYRAEWSKINTMRRNNSYIELFPYADSPMVYEPQDVERYGLLKLAKAIGHYDDPVKNLYLLVSEKHIYTFIQIAGIKQEPSMKKILNTRIECQKLGLQFRLAPSLESQIQDNFYKTSGINYRTF